MDIFDITNPEVEPSLLMEFQVPDGSYAMVYPTVVTFKDPAAALDANDWYLAFGNGPDTLNTAARKKGDG